MQRVVVGAGEADMVRVEWFEVDLGGLMGVVVVLMMCLRFEVGWVVRRLTCGLCVVSDWEGGGRGRCTYAFARL